MAERKRGGLIVIIVSLVLAVANTFFFFRRVKPNLSGMAIRDLSGVFSKPDFATIAFIAQWVLVLAIVIFVYAKRFKREKEEEVHIEGKEIKVKAGKSSTDIDSLYSLLKEKKHLNIKVISKIFGIKKEKAFEWAKILEDYDLAVISYPPFSDPELEIAGENEKTTQKIK
jgi:hypothetical protein